MGIRVLIEIVAKEPLTVLASPASGYLKKAAAAVACVAFTFLSCGYYAWYAKNFFAHREVQNISLAFENYVEFGMMNEAERYLVTYPYLGKMLNADLPFNETFDRPFCLLQKAVIAGNIQMATLLINNGADLEANSRAGISLNCLLNDSYWNEKHPDGDHRIRMEMLELLLNRGAKVEDGYDILQRYLMYSESSAKTREIIELLINHGADLNSTRFIHSPLGMAASAWREGEDNTELKEILSLMASRGALFRTNEANINPEAVNYVQSLNLLH